MKKNRVKHENFELKGTDVVGVPAKEHAFKQRSMNFLGYGFRCFIFLNFQEQDFTYFLCLAGSFRLDGGGGAVPV